MEKRWFNVIIRKIDVKWMLLWIIAASQFHGKIAKQALSTELEVLLPWILFFRENETWQINRPEKFIWGYSIFAWNCENHYLYVKGAHRGKQQRFCNTQKYFVKLIYSTEYYDVFCENVVFTEYLRKNCNIKSSTLCCWV